MVRPYKQSRIGERMMLEDVRLEYSVLILLFEA